MFMTSLSDRLRLGERVQLMDMTDYSTFELDIPEELKGKLNSGEEVNYFNHLFGVC